MIVRRFCPTVVGLLVLGGSATLRAQQEPTPPSEKPTGQSEQEESRDRPVQLQPVVVTARQIAEPVSDTPQSVTVVSGQQVQSQGLRTVRDAARLVPNMIVTEFASRRLSFPYIRGIGSGQGDPAVTTFVDGVPQLTTSSTNLPLLDVESVEVLRGPSSALYGRNTLGGSIHVRTRRPTNEFEATAEASLGNFSSEDYRLSIGTPLIEDELFFRGSLLRSERDGFTENTLTGNDVDYRDSWFGRGQLVWLPNDTQEVTLTVYGEQARDGGFVLTDLGGLRSNPYRLTQDFEGRVDRDVFAASLQWERHGTDVDLTSITGFQDWRIAESSDFDFSALDGVRRFTREDQTYVYQEFRAQSAEGADLHLAEDAVARWVVGVTGFVSDEGREAANEFRPGGAGIIFAPSMVGTSRARGDFDSRAFGVFGQMVVTLFDDLELTGALRYDYEDKEAEIANVFESGGFTVPVSSTDNDESFDQISPRVSAAYHACDQATVYALAARGFKAGGFNLTAPTGSEAFGPETSWTYEAGLKTNWFDERLSANGSVFYIDWEDMQLSQFDATTGGYVTNAGESRSQGFELEFVGRPCDSLQVFAGLGYTDTKFDRFTDSFGQNVAGRNLPFAPDTTVHLGAQFTTALRDGLDTFFRADYFHVGEFYFDAGNLGRERYELVNLRAGFGGDRWRLDGWIENAFDEAYVPVALQANPADPTAFVGENAAPRTFGATMRVNF